MIYYLALLIQWIGRAFVPTAVLFAGGAIVLCGIWWLILRPRRLSASKPWLALGLIALAFGGWRTWGVWQDFSHPELTMFRKFVADPIPRELQALAPATAAPVMFHDGAYISFCAPRELVDRIVNHSLPGSKTLAAIAEMKQHSPRDTADQTVIAAGDGQSYLKVDLDWVTKENSPESQWARGTTEAFLKNQKGDAYVLLRAGPWGRFASILQYEPHRLKSRHPSKPGAAKVMSFRKVLHEAI